MGLGLRDASAGLPTGAHKRAVVQAMFDRIAPGYDRVNRIISAGRDQGWRERTLEAVGVGPGDRLVDVACGTGDFVALARRRGATCVGVDFADEMLRLARVRQPGVAWVRGDALALPVPDASATVVTCGFALRNVVSIPEALAEMARVLVPGGRVALLEVDRPDPGVLRLGHSLWTDVLVPRIGGLLSDREAYAYLPRSTAYLPPAPELARWIEEAGFRGVSCRRFLLGAAQCWIGVRR